ncbi:MAG: hypothetical protein JWO95_193 [Verrucomicrobiales bacterium]|nr:hypothetical protein [Verrucomicrobiales bacterium]
MDHAGIREDFVLKLEFRAGVNAGSGLIIRKPQLQVRDYLVAGPYKLLKKYKPQDWNKIEVIVKGRVTHCTCNGEVLEEALKSRPPARLALKPNAAKWNTAGCASKNCRDYLRGAGLVASTPFGAEREPERFGRNCNLCA